VYNWLSHIDLPAGEQAFNIVEVRFKNSRKEFYLNTHQLPLQEGDIVTVDVKQGYDVGIVSLTGELVRLQMNKHKIYPKQAELGEVVRKATQKDIDDWQKGRAREAEVMFQSRTLALQLGLQMKISDVEYQGDLSKATFYYTAEERVDFRELIKKMAAKFKVRIEMKQIGMRQEAGRLGGIGSCGRELCCSTWLTDFRSVSTSAARYQQLSLNPAKLAGQCGKLKCCLNYELDLYLEELKEFPDTKYNLKTDKGEAFFQKMDIFGRKMWYSYQDSPNEFIELTLDRVKEISQVNRKGNKVAELLTPALKEDVPSSDYANVVGQDSLTRFDHRRKKRRKKKRRKPNPSKKQS
jgi:cell fate regulator YaaT (PSP1 superfamily)